MEYDRFSPTGDALITLTGPDFLRDSLRLLERLTIAGTPVSAKQKIVIEGRQRTRGTKGRAEAEERGLIGGNGPHAGSLTKTGRMAVIWGFPGKMTADVVSQHFKDFKMERSGRDKVSVRRVPLYVISPVLRQQILTLDQTERCFQHVFTFCCHSRICVGSSPPCPGCSYDVLEP